MGVPKFGVVSTGLVSVLFVNVSVVAFPTKVSVATGSVSVLEPLIAGALMVIEPLVSPDTTTLLIRSPLLVDPMWSRYQRASSHLAAAVFP